MKKQIGLVIAFIFEVSLLIVVVIFLLLGIVGIFLPIIPGLVLIGIAVAIYAFLIRDEKNKLSRYSHRYVIKFKSYFNKLIHPKIYMGIIKTIKKRREEAIKVTVIKYGLILFGFNLALIMFLFFALTGAGTILTLLDFSQLVLTFVPLLIIFLFAAVCSIIWYRFGQILRKAFKDKLVLYSGLVVLISIVPLLLILFFLSLIISSGLATYSFWWMIFIINLLITVLAVVFEFFIVSLGSLTRE